MATCKEYFDHFKTPKWIKIFVTMNFTTQEILVTE